MPTLARPRGPSGRGRPWRRGLSVSTGIRIPLPWRDPRIGAGSIMTAGTPGSQAEGNSSVQPGEALAALPGGSCVLVVDDDADILNLIRMVLEEEGYGVVTAENGEQALRRTTEQPPDLILLDLTMPVLNGWQTRERLARDWPEIPVVFMTAGFRAKAEAEAYRVAGYLAKPFDVDDLLRTVARFIPQA